MLPEPSTFCLSSFFFFSHAFSNVSWTCFLISLTCFSESFVGSSTRPRL